ncbi:MAG: leucine-rich repeat domain-containing protein, partial [archaeon]|nr:leucine-rich repeat domain-containing protein [archaeon]
MFDVSGTVTLPGSGYGASHVTVGDGSVASVSSYGTLTIAVSVSNVSLLGWSLSDDYNCSEGDILLGDGSHRPIEHIGYGLALLQRYDGTGWVDVWGDKFSSKDNDSLWTYAVPADYVSEGTWFRVLQLTEYKADGKDCINYIECFQFYVYDGKCGDSLTWYMEGDTLVVEGSGRMYDYDYTLVNGVYGTTAPWGGFVYGSVRNVVIRDGVTSVAKHAFIGCTSIISIDLPSGLIDIGESAFSHCTSLARIGIPSSVNKIGDMAFRSCTSLDSFSGDYDGIVSDGCALLSPDGRSL